MSHQSNRRDFLKTSAAAVVWHGRAMFDSSIAQSRQYRKHQLLPVSAAPEGSCSSDLQ